MQKKSTFAKRLQAGMDAIGITASEVSRRTGISKSSISHYLKGHWEAKQDALYKLANLLNVSEPWLMGCDVPMERKASILHPIPRVTDNVVVFPVIGEVAAGYNKIAMEDWTGETVEIPESYLHGRPRDDFFVLTVHGDSMYPLYIEGDKVLVLRCDELPRSGDVGVFLYDGESSTLKRIEYREQEELIRLVPINPMRPPEEVKGPDLALFRTLGIPKLIIRHV